jgi:hypothetical protein
MQSAEKEQRSKWMSRGASDCHGGRHAQPERKMIRSSGLERFHLHGRRQLEEGRGYLVVRGAQDATRGESVELESSR